MHQNYHFIVMLSQMLLHVSAHHHHQGAHTIFTSYLSLHITQKLWNIEWSSSSNMNWTRCTPWAMFHNSHCLQQQLTISTYIHSAKLLIGATALDIPLSFCNVHRNMLERLTKHHNKVIILMHLLVFMKIYTKRLGPATKIYLYLLIFYYLPIFTTMNILFWNSNAQLKCRTSIRNPFHSI
jgi:hypothetical protein